MSNYLYLATIEQLYKKTALQRVNCGCWVVVMMGREVSKPVATPPPYDDLRPRTIHTLVEAVSSTLRKPHRPHIIKHSCLAKA
ncbi:hypothetical protein P167DRAFT_111387 [Morchella conica CCBAS932]|uniref:Uncharacterized protein n=1 Tax=Morchella conica CCBAS932 TaxID=1392247 RepID=A0A3N4L5P8_9PEZI|nr:hypothetical protein P167DRAFT_111387 [Morchella conica CCBAS932]